MMTEQEKSELIDTLDAFLEERLTAELEELKQEITNFRNLEEYFEDLVIQACIHFKETGELPIRRRELH